MLSLTSKLFNIKNAASSSLILSRSYVFPSDLKIKWKRPEWLPCYKPVKTGDLEGFEKPDGSRHMLNYDKSELLKNADELVQNMFKLELNRRGDSVVLAKKEMIKKVQRHDLDLGSIESKSKFFSLYKMNVSIIDSPFSRKNDS